MKAVKLLEVARLRSLLRRLISQYGQERAMDIVREALETEVKI